MKRADKMMDAAEKYADEIYGEEYSQDKILLMNAYAAGWQDADSHPAWIPVEEELPPKMDKWTKASDYVLVYTNEGEWLIGRYWHDGDGWSVSGLTKAKVTHWMPIVPPRKEE